MSPAEIAISFEAGCLKLNTMSKIKCSLEYWDWEVEETETSLVFKVNGRQVYKATRANNKTKDNEN